MIAKWKDVNVIVVFTVFDQLLKTFKRRINWNHIIAQSENPQGWYIKFFQDWLRVKSVISGVIPKSIVGPLGHVPSSGVRVRHRVDVV